MGAGYLVQTITRFVREVTTSLTPGNSDPRTEFLLRQARPWCSRYQFAKPPYLWRRFLDPLVNRTTNMEPFNARASASELVSGLEAPGAWAVKAAGSCPLALSRTR